MMRYFGHIIPSSDHCLNAHNALTLWSRRCADVSNLKTTVYLVLLQHRCLHIAQSSIRFNLFSLINQHCVQCRGDAGEINYSRKKLQDGSYKKIIILCDILLLYSFHGKKTVRKFLLSRCHLCTTLVLPRMKHVCVHCSPPVCIVVVAWSKRTGTWEHWGMMIYVSVQCPLHACLSIFMQDTSQAWRC